jgi:hypothetical protein
MPTASPLNLGTGAPGDPRKGGMGESLEDGDMPWGRIVTEVLKRGFYILLNSKGSPVAGGLCSATGTTFHNKGRHAYNVTNGTISDKETVGISCRTHGVDGCVQRGVLSARGGMGAPKAPE